MKIKPTLKEKRIAKSLIEGKTKQQALLDAGYAKTTAHSQCGIADRPGVKQAIADVLHKAGLSDEVLAKKHLELLHATKTISTVSGKDAGTGTMDFVDVPDYAVQAKALDMGYKVKGHYIERVDSRTEHIIGDMPLSELGDIIRSVTKGKEV